MSFVEVPAKDELAVYTYVQPNIMEPCHGRDHRHAWSYVSYCINKHKWLCLANTRYISGYIPTSVPAVCHGRYLLMNYRCSIV